MKKMLLLITIFLAVSCTSDDDDNPTPTPTPTPGTMGKAIINEVAFNGPTNLIEIKNVGGSPIDVSNYWLCLGSGTYRKLSALNLNSGNLTIPAGGFAVVEYGMARTAGGLGLYKNNSGFANSANLASFVQWGAGGSQRESVAVAANLWTAGQFVAVSNSTTSTIAYDGTGNAASDWSEDTTPTLGSPNG